MEQPKKELCRIQIMFPVESDEEALAVKRKVSEALKGNEAVSIRFEIMTQPGR